VAVYINDLNYTN